MRAKVAHGRQKVEANEVLVIFLCLVTPAKTQTSG
jgi:hypothetical protein